MKFSKRTHRLIMIQFWNSTPSYDTKLDLLDRLKRTNFVNFQPFYDSQVGHFMGKVTETTLPISLELSQVIAHQQEYIKQYLGTDYQYLFCARRSGQKKFTPVPSVMRAQPFVRYLNILAAKFDICDFTGKRWQFQSHQFRHTVATRMINNGVPQHIVQRYLGHESPQMTAMYAHIHDSTLRTAIDRYLSTKVVDINGEVIQSLAPELDDNSELQWLKKKVLAETLSNGYCGLPAQLTCSKGNACLTCSDSAPRSNI